MSITAMKQALEFIDANADGADERDIALALRQAIEQAEKQEPVAWLQFRNNESPVVAPRNLGTPVYLGIRGGLAHDAGEQK